MEDSEMGEVQLQRDLHRIMSDDPKTTGAYMFTSTHAAAPNPCLEVDGLGTLGLPLSPQMAEEAQNVLRVGADCDHSTDADNLAIDSNKIQCENSKWSRFMDETVKQACEALGVDFEACKPDSRMRKLVISTANHRHPLNLTESERGDGAFAYLVVILPTRFNGGAIRFAHGDRTETYECSNNSLTSTKVLTWYINARAVIDPILDGHWLALFYTIHTAVSPLPTLSQQDAVISQIQRVLQSWTSSMKEEAKVPKQLVYLLSNNYSRDKLCGALLTGQDARTITLLNNASKKHGLKIGLASMTCTANGYGAPSMQAEDGDSGDGFFDELQIHCNNPSIIIEDVVDIDGSSLCSLLEHNLKLEAIPPSWPEALLESKAEKQRFLYSFDDSMALERVFHRTVLILWPPWSPYAVNKGLDAAKPADATMSQRPAKRRKTRR